MDSSRKRKATNATPASSEPGPTKKLKLLNSHPAPASKSKVQEVGYKILEQLRHAADKNGRLIAVEFLALPDRDELPDYYEFTKLPVALETIEKKLKRNEFPTITTIESDVKRMIQNAKDYNDPKSEIYEDAERIRKLTFNFMKVHNPAYAETPGYSAFPTPITSKSTLPVANGAPGKEDGSKATESRETLAKSKRSVVASSSDQAERKASVAPSATTGEAEEGDEEEDESGDGDIEFSGKTFQQAQQMIITHLLYFKDEEGLQIYRPFGNLPNRNILDYYKLIRHPVSLRLVAKGCRGQHGRAPPTGVSDFKSWDAFEDEVSYIWRNAKEYNEDGSEMYNLATDFEEHFKNLVEEAKGKVEEPAGGPRIKIGGPKPKVTLSLSQHRQSPTPGVTIDNDALARQRQMVQAGVNGLQQSPRPAPAVNGVATSNPQVATVSQAKSSSSLPPGSPLGGAMKVESTATQSPAPVNPAPPTTQQLPNGTMPPPAFRPPSGSPYPSHQPTANHFYVAAPALLPPIQIRPYPIDSVLLPTVTISSHPHLKTAQPFRLSIPPHDTLSRQSTTVTLPSSHSFLQIAPTISKQLSMGRPYKMFVAVNGMRLTQRDTQFHADSGKRTHVYEGSLAQGVNRVEVEVAAASAKQDADGRGLDVEKVTVFVNLLRGA